MRSRPQKSSGSSWALPRIRVAVELNTPRRTDTSSHAASPSKLAILINGGGWLNSSRALDRCPCATYRRFARPVDHSDDVRSYRSARRSTYESTWKTGPIICAAQRFRADGGLLLAARRSVRYRRCAAVPPSLRHDAASSTQSLPLGGLISEPAAIQDFPPEALRITCSRENPGSRISRLRRMTQNHNAYADSINQLQTEREMRTSSTRTLASVAEILHVESHDFL